MPHSILLEVWREACRHIDLAEALDGIARILPAAFPADLLVAWRVDAARRHAETAATGARGEPRPEVPARRSLSPDDLHRLLRWCGAGGAVRCVAGGDPGALAPLLSPALAGEFLAGPLARDGDELGVLLAHARPGATFDDAALALFAALLEPVAVALANDARLQELVRLREALEADKRALLSRLDRQDVADAIVGADAGLRSVMARVEQVAPTDAPVLILGETGTGKEVLARAIHARSRRARGPVVRVNCGALPPGLVDSELFGHERGSFTGAVATRKGWFERADGGTLFLDEIAELPLDAQVRLLRIVQDGTFERVGGSRSLTVDVRIVCATHRDLRAMVAAGTFREDLWYRIGIFPIHLPPLRERLEDIPPLAAHFAWRAGQRLGGAPLTPSADDVELLVAYDWPGNVRELAAVIERAAILGDGRHLDVAGALGVAGRTAAARGSAAADPRAAAPDDDEVVPLDAAMARHIERALRARGGRIEGRDGAARLLGINPHTLRARMRKLGIEWGRFRATASLLAAVALAAPWLAAPSPLRAQAADSVAARRDAWRAAEEERIHNDWASLARYRDENAALGAPRPAERRVVFMGNSITEGFAPHFAELFPGKPYIGRGISGQTTPQMLVRFRQDVIALRPDVVVLLAGTNDIAGNTGPTTLEAIEANIVSMTELARANGIRVVLASVLPAADFPWRPGLDPATRIRELNARLRAHAARAGVVWLDYHAAMADARGGLRRELSDDGVHPNIAGYRVMAPLAERAIEQALGR